MARISSSGSAASPLIILAVVSPDGRPGRRRARRLEPDRVVSKSQPLEVAGRRLVLIASGGRDAPGTLALWDETTGTLIVGSLVSIDRALDLRGHRPGGIARTVRPSRIRAVGRIPPRSTSRTQTVPIGEWSGTHPSMEVAMPALSGTRSAKFPGHAAAGVAGCMHDGTTRTFVRRVLIDARFPSGT
jgi:hypothetical protein